MFSKQIALVVDDSSQVRGIVTRILKHDLGFGQVLSATNGKQAFQLFESDNVDWVFCDWEMPVMNGHDLLQALRKHPRGRNIPFVLMTGYADKDTLATAMEAGITDFVAKPFSPSILTQKVRRIAAAIERRAAARITPQGRYPAQIVFACGASYEAMLEDISATGCLLRTMPLTKGGTVCDAATLTLKLEAKPIVVKSTTIRIALNNSSDNPQQNVLVAFKFDANYAVTNAIKLFITQQQATEKDQGGEELVF